MKSGKTIQVNTAEQFRSLFGAPSTRHPLMTVCPLSDLRPEFRGAIGVRMGLYTIIAKDGGTCTGTYGWREYDFTKGAMNFLSPGQEFQWGNSPDNTGRWGWVLAFHPDFVRRHALYSKLEKLHFFSYSVSEALHVSEAERETIDGLFQDLSREYSRDIDEHTQGIIVSLIDVLLGYSERFYTRQFRTRQAVEPDILSRFKAALDAHYGGSEPLLASVSKIADDLAMTPHYLSDYLRARTGLSTQQQIHAYLIDKAKGLLLSTDLPVGEIASSLGFEYPQHFTRMFKSKTGLTPLQYRREGYKN